jgi:hypothetical protein
MLSSHYASVSISKSEADIVKHSLDIQFSIRPSSKIRGVYCSTDFLTELFVIIIALLAEGQGILKLFRSAVTVIVTPTNPLPPHSTTAHTLHTPNSNPFFAPNFQ